MATKEDFDVVLNRIDAAEVAVKTKIDAMKAEIVALQEQIKGLGLDATTEANILASLDKQAAFLEALVAPEAPAQPAA